MQEFNLTLKVETNAQLDEKTVTALVHDLLTAGVNQAVSGLESGQCNTEQAKLVASLQLHEPEIAKPAKVLVVVEGGIADAVWDGGVGVEVFDWDNYNNDPDGTGPVPAAYAALAGPINVPFEKVSQDSPGQTEEEC